MGPCPWLGLWPRDAVGEGPEARLHPALGAQRAAEGGEEKGKAEVSSGVQVWIIWMCPVLGFRFKAKILM